MLLEYVIALTLVDINILIWYYILLKTQNRKPQNGAQSAKNAAEDLPLGQSEWAEIEARRQAQLAKEWDNMMCYNGKAQGGE